MRHAAHAQGTLTEDGIKGVERVAAALDEVLEGRGITVVALHTTPSPEVAATARLLRNRSRAARIPAPQALALPVPGPYTKEARRLTEVKGIVKMLCDSDNDPVEEDRAVVLVGNDPFVGWVANQMLGGSRTVGLAYGEVACLCRRGEGRTWRLEWTLAPDDRSAVEPLLAKIKSKMDTAKVLGAIVVALLTFLVQSFFVQGVPSPAALVALGCFAAGAWLYLAALCSSTTASHAGSVVGKPGELHGVGSLDWQVGASVGSSSDHRRRPPGSCSRTGWGSGPVCSCRRPC